MQLRLAQKNAVHFLECLPGEIPRGLYLLGFEQL
jgi:hypothetical protein